MAAAPEAAHSTSEHHDHHHATATTRKWSDVDHFRLLGAVAVTTTTCCVASQPLYVVLARQQCSRIRLTMSGVGQSIWKELGIRGFFRGCAASVMGMVVFQMLYYVVVETAKEYLPISSKAARDFCAGFCADGLTNPLYIPFTVIAQHQMVAGFGVAKDEVYANMRVTANNLISHSGKRALFRGLGLSMVMLPLSGLWWSVYEQMKLRAYHCIEQTKGRQIVPSWVPTSSLPSCCTSRTDNVLVNLVVGGVASCLVTCFANPLYVIRSRVQVMRVPAGVGSTTLWVAKDLLHKEGFRGFFRGLGTNIVLSISEGSIFAGTYEGTKFFADITDPE